MKKTLPGAALAVALGLGAISGATIAEAQGKKPSQEAPQDPTGGAPVTKKTIALIPQGIAWGMSPKQVATLIDKLLDEIYKPLYQKISPGVAMRALDAELAEEKSIFRRSRIDFKNLPTGIDATPLRGEYTYNNKESLLTLTRGKKKTHFFFIQDKLWKIIDERALGGDPKDSDYYGKDFVEVVVKLASVYEMPGRVLEPDFEKGRNALEIDWKDAATHLRAIQRSDTAYAIALEDNLTLGNLASLRVNKPQEEADIDPDVAAAVRKDDAPAPPAGKK